MTEHTATEYTPTEVSPPGNTLAELLEERGITQAELATRMGRPRKTISEIINGKAAITFETANQLALVTNVPAEFWNAREQRYRAHLAAKEEARRLEAEYRWCKNFPLKEMRKLGWLTAVEPRVSLVRELFSFLGVVSSEQWAELYSDVEVAFRRPQKFAPDQYALGAWLRRGLIEAQRLRTEPYDRLGFEARLHEARALTRRPPAEFSQLLVQWCSSAGVALVFVPELPRSRACGATRWLSTDKAMIQLSLRYRTNDHLWFTFFHEAAHLLLHGKKLIFIEGNGGNGSAEEEEADNWASSFLVPPNDYERLVESGDWSGATICAFAERIGIAPGIVVGRLQHDGHVPHHALNDLKERYEWKSP